MTCSAHLTALRDHAAGAEAKPDLLAHVRVCPTCTEVLEAERYLLSDLDAVIGELSRLQPSPAALAGARSLASTVHAPWLIPYRRWAVAALLLMGLAIAFPQRPPIPVSSQEAHLPPLPRVPPAAPTGHPVTTRDSSSPPGRRANPIPEAVIVVPPGQEAAVLRFAEVMTSGVAIVPASLLDSEARSAPIAEPPDLTTPLLNIEPIRADEAPEE
jgi:hypothetical protein